jgi:hypothetical protein
MVLKRNNGAQRVKKGSNYLNVLSLSELNYLLVSSCLFQTGCFLIYDMDNIELGYIDTSSRKQFIYGTTLAFATLGIFSDSILRGKKFYTLLVLFMLVEVSF